MKAIEAVIFDWAGTTVDYGCMAPVYAMQKAFAEKDIKLTLEEIRKPMGLLKSDHIKAVLAMERVRDDFKKMHGRHHEPQDIAEIYAHFEKNIFPILHQHANVIEGVLSAQTYLRKQHIKIGSTTGYTKAMLTIVADRAKEQEYSPDFIISADQVRHARPYPYMIHQNMAALEVEDCRCVIKIGDTLVDILEGIHAGCWSVGVVKGGSILGLSTDEVSRLSANEFNQMSKGVRQQMLAAGADYVIDSMAELPEIIASINEKLASKGKSYAVTRS